MIRLYTTEEVAQLLSVSPRTIRRERAAGRLGCVLIRKQVRFRQSDVEQYLAACVISSGTATMVA
jgi:excisionase family DNA binding protein